MTASSAAPAPGEKHYKLFAFFLAGFVAVLLCSNLIGPAKVCRIELPFALPFLGSALVFGAGNIFFPISYILDDVLTEVYGYAKARQVIWAGFAAMLFATLMTWSVIHLPVDSGEPFNQTLQPAIEVVFGSTWRIALGSIVAFWAGDFANSYVLAKMKLLTRGRFLWMRTIGSTIVGEGLDSLIFYPLAFAGLWSSEKLLAVVVFNWFFKVGVEIVFTPVTYLVVGFVKRVEHEDVYDRGTNFTPFSLEE